MGDTMKILLPVDDSPCTEAAVAMLVARVRPERVEVRVFHAIEWLKDMPQSFRYAVGPNAASDIEAWRRQSIREAEELVYRVSTRLRAAGFYTSTATADEDPRRAIVDEAVQWGADLIVIGSHGRRGFDRFVLGSVAESVVRHAPCSVEIVRARPRTAAEPRLSTAVV